MTDDTVWFCLIGIWILGELVIAFATRTRSGQGSLRDRGTQVILWVTIVLSFFAAGWSTIFHAAGMPFPKHLIHTMAIVLLVAGLVVRGIAIFTLGKFFSANVAIHAEHTLQRSGLYRFVRHPSYLGMEIAFFASGLYECNWLSFAILAVLPTCAVLYRIHVEEAALLDAFGDEYAAYCKTTKRLLPGIY
jgi:protein-S-isoprenylcysteine O-methyltransferase Ste14